MRSFIASLRNLVLPFGTTSGQRIVLDSDNGVISIYDQTNALLAQIGPTFTPEVGFTSYDYTFPYTIKGMLSGGSLVFEHDGSNQWTNGVIETTAGGNPLTYLDLTITPGAPTAPTNRPELTMTSQVGVNPLIEMAAGGGGSTPLEWTIDGVHQGRGLVAQATRTANSSAVSAETVLTTLAGVVFRAGRAYRITALGLVTSSVAGDQVSNKFREGSGTSGTILGDNMAGVTIATAATNKPLNMVRLVRNATAADITTDVSLTYQRFSGTGNVQVLADATNPATFMVEDIGRAADYPSVRQV